MHLLQELGILKITKKISGDDFGSVVPEVGGLRQSVLLDGWTEKEEEHTYGKDDKHRESQDVVTLITRPRRFGKTLNMSMLEKFFSAEYAGRGICSRGWRSGSRRSTAVCRGRIR